MKSLLTITTPATDLTLLTLDEMRAATNVTGNGQDATLRSMERRVAAAIMSECGIAIGAGSPPTLHRETVTQTFRQDFGFYDFPDALILARRHDVEIASLVEDTETVVDTDYLVDPESGLVSRLRIDQPTVWIARKIVVTYAAGFATIPEDLKQAATDFMRLLWFERKRDPSLKSEVVLIPDVRRVEQTYWVGSVPGQSTEGPVPDVVAGQLTRFRNTMGA
ncbi:hypothetical protein C8D77_101210 [Mesorhizobium loti]|uniref:Phage gp6-like head-tail connector protein n=1 Tax=Rhizobium loti TaxID=381 RepID=A0A8E3B650_RHILI|nr:hypothetical protein [Mesorhizobium loti]PWJ93531.1 hypothetical protein C8D77_101210 [Mesorhizobium loti]